MSDTIFGALIGVGGLVLGIVISTAIQYFQSQSQRKQWFAQFFLPRYLDKVSDLYAAVIDYNSKLSTNRSYLDAKHVEPFVEHLALPTIREYFQNRNEELRASRARFELAYAHARTYTKHTTAEPQLTNLQAIYLIVGLGIEDNTSPTNLQNFGPRTITFDWGKAEAQMNKSVAALDELLNPETVQSLTRTFLRISNNR